MRNRASEERVCEHTSARWSELLWQLVRPYGRAVYYALWPERRPDYFSASWRCPSARLEPEALGNLSFPPVGENRSAFLFFPMVDWHVRFQRFQHLAQTLAGMGHTCIYVNPQLGLEYQAPYAFDPQPRIGLLADGIFELHVHLPLEHESHARALRPPEARRVARVVETVLQAGKFREVTQIVGFPRWLPVAQSIRSSFGYPIVYDCHDYLRGFGNISEEILHLEDVLLENSDFVVFSSDHLQETMTSRSPSVRQKAALIRNGANPLDFTGALNHPRQAGRPIIGYAGALEWWFDVDLLLRVASLNPDCLFQLLGRVEDPGVLRLKACSNVEFVGEVPYRRIPDYMKAWDAAMIPFLRSPVTDAADVLKLYEYFSAGLPVICTPLPQVERFRDLVYIEADAAGFSAGIREALAERDEAKRERRLAVAREATWVSRAAALLELIRRPRSADSRATLGA